MVYVQYNRIFAVGTPVEELPFLSLEDFNYIKGLPARAFILTLDSITKLQGTLLR